MTQKCQGCIFAGTYADMGATVPVCHRRDNLEDAAKACQDEGACEVKLTYECVDHLEIMLFAVVRATILPISIRLGKTEAELTAKTIETIKETEKTIDFERMRELMQLKEE